MSEKYLVIMKVSVIIPVYNAETYLRESVESALAQAETGEVVLVEDGSPDNSLAECQKLAAQYDRVKLFQHPDKGNHGAGATRNLAIQKAQYEYVAFLDADDLYLENRFQKAREIFEQDDTVEGVYEAIGTKFENEEVKKEWLKSGRPYITTVSRRVDPEDLLEKLIMFNYGHFHGDGLVVRRTIFDKAGLFQEDLRVSQDTHMYLKMAAVGRLRPGDLEEPVALRRVHSDNRFNKLSVEEKQAVQLKVFSYLETWSEEKGLPERQKAFIRYKRFFLENIGDYAGRSKLKRLFKRSAVTLKFIFTHSLFQSRAILGYYSRKIFKG